MSRVVCPVTVPCAHVDHQCPHKNTTQHTHKEETTTSYGGGHMICAHMTRVRLDKHTVTNTYVYESVYNYVCRM